ncbi:MAG: hypothetical protein DRO92_04400, partial [Candidatus Altiarchaeales archaeon]
GIYSLSITTIAEISLLIFLITMKANIKLERDNEMLKSKIKDLEDFGRLMLAREKHFIGLKELRDKFGDGEKN